VAGVGVADLWEVGDDERDLALSWVASWSDEVSNMLASSLALEGLSLIGKDALLAGAGADLGGGEDRNGEVGGAVVKVDELVVACNRATANFEGAISCLGAGSSTRSGDDFSPLALALMTSISRRISSASTSSSSSLSIPRSSRDVFQDASPVDHRFSNAFDGESRIG